MVVTGEAGRSDHGSFAADAATNRDRRAAHHYLLADIEAIPHDAEVLTARTAGGPVVRRRFTRCTLSELYRVGPRPGGVVAFTLCCEGRCRAVEAWRAVDVNAHANSFCRKGPLTTRYAATAERLVILGAMTLWFEDALSAMRSKLQKALAPPHLHEGRKTDVLTRARQTDSAGMAAAAGSNR